MKPIPNGQLPCSCNPSVTLPFTADNAASIALQSNPVDIHTKMVIVRTLEGN